MTLLAVTADTWIVTGLGFGIVLALLFCLVFILQFFGWTMQKMTAPAAPKNEKKESDDMAAVAMALYLSNASKHDATPSMITFDRRETAWNPKSEGFNNVGF
jgi:Na+-transporting methylmalonyl-CoA/oxaloacetate decarboxylase gamma subunit